MLNTKVIVANNWSDPRLVRVVDHAMLVMAPGVYYHSRLDTVIIIRPRLDVEYNGDLVLDKD
jgi:hypothetical protein